MSAFKQNVGMVVAEYPINNDAIDVGPRVERYLGYLVSAVVFKGHHRAALRPAYCKPGATHWKITHVVKATEGEAINSAKACVEYDLRVSVWELAMGRKYDPCSDGDLELLPWTGALIEAYRDR